MRLLRLLDTPLVATRTAREVALTGIGLFGVVWGLVGAGPYGIEWSAAWAVVTAAFVARVWAARGLAVGACLASIAQWMCASELRSWPWIVNVPVVSLLLLASRDLVARFEERPSGWLPNPWAAMPRPHAQRLRWCAYAAGVMACVLCQMWCQGERAFPATPALFWSLGAMIALLAVGRAVTLLPLAAAGVVVSAAAARGALAGDVGSIEAVASALATTGLAAPYVVRLLAGPPVAARVRVAAAASTRVEAAELDAAEVDAADLDASVRRGRLQAGAGPQRQPPKSCVQ
jgi:hypothetical protein